jgi:nitroreductase
MDYFELIRNRFSVRAYTDRKVEKDTLEKILEAGRLAPTACNLQAFRILVIPVEKYSEQLKKIYPRPFLIQAPLVLGVYANEEKNWIRSDGKNYAYVDAAIVMDHLILAATSFGLGTCWVGAFDAEQARSFAGLGAGWEPVAFTPLGYPDKSAPEKQRKELAGLVTYL